MNLEDKKALVSTIACLAEKSNFVIVADYRGLSVALMTSLRAKARENGDCVRVVRNTLARRAISGTAFSCLQEVLSGPSLFIFCHKDPGNAVRLVQAFAKENKALEVKALSFGNVLLQVDALETVANLPTHDAALGLLMATMMGPVTQCARVLSEVYAECVRVLSAIADKKRAD